MADGVASNGPWPIDLLDTYLPADAAALRRTIRADSAPRLPKMAPVKRYWVVLVDLWYRTPENSLVIIVDSHAATVEQIGDTALSYFFEDLDHLWLLETLGPGNRLYLEKGEPAIAGVTKVDGAHLLRPGHYRIDGDKHYKWWIGWRDEQEYEGVFSGVPGHLRSKDPTGSARGLFTTSRTALMDFDFGDNWHLVFRNLADLTEIASQLPAPVVIVAATAPQLTIQQYAGEDADE